MSNKRKYAHLKDWLAVKNCGFGRDPGRRPDLDDMVFHPHASLPPTSTRVNGMTSLHPDPEIAAERRSARVDAQLDRLGVRPRRRR